jgi:hypothetical protein
VRRLLAALVGATAAVTLLEVVLAAGAHAVPGLLAGFAIAGGALLIVGAKALGRLGLSRPEPPPEPPDD